jgi:hypothetical protein
MMAIDAMIAGRTFRDHCERVMSDDDAFKHRAIFFEAPHGFMQADDAQSSSAHDRLEDQRPGRWSWGDLLTSNPTSRRRL